MKKIFSILMICGVAMGVYAVPAKPGWHKMSQADGTTIEVQLVGDECYHYMINRDGKQVKLNAAGMYEVVGEAPQTETVIARRVAGQARRQPKSVGVEPNLAPKGVVILANFADTKMRSEHTLAVFDELCNSTNCTVNACNGKNYPSAAEYFASQSNGTYRPQFDVFGPVTLSHGYAYYGANVNDKDGADTLATEAVVEACLLANEQYEIDFTQYDSDNDGYVDFVYVIYAGRSEASGGSANTIWPHNWTVSAGRHYGNCTYTKNQARVDGKYLENYACSNELEIEGLCGIGTLCHEFGHVMGLPDFYDTGDGYNESLTPNSWDIMDIGSYNGNSHCPPNYNPWEKYFFGWMDPVNLDTLGGCLELHPNGTPDYTVLQVNVSGAKEAATQEGLNYYIENRQQEGWDEYLLAHGMLIWKVNFDAAAWRENAPNNTRNRPKLTLVCSNGTIVGKTEESAAGNVFPYKGNGTQVDSWEGIDFKPVYGITETDGIITATYITDSIPLMVNWLVDGDTIASEAHCVGESLSLPSENVADTTNNQANQVGKASRMPMESSIVTCAGTELIGWTAEQEWCDPIADPDDLFTSAEGKQVRGNVTYRAVMQ